MANLAPSIIEPYKNLIKELINFFTCEASGGFEEVKEICKRINIQMKKERFNTAIDLGYLSTDDFLMYATEKKMVNSGIPIDVVDMVLKILVEEHVVKITPSSFLNSFGIRYKANGKFTKYLHERDLILNLVGGWLQIINNYRFSVVKIEHIKSNDDRSIGTGYYYAAGNEAKVNYIIVTNRHVVEKAKKINLILENGTAIPYKEIIQDPQVDLAYIILEEPLNTPYLDFEPKPEVLSEIITIGYPSIPMAKDAYQVYHKGEVNSFIEDYQSNKFFLISAKTSSGNSGSPILNKYGLVVGIVAQDFFEKEQFFEKGKPSYYAGIPSEEIIKSMNTYVFK